MKIASEFNYRNAKEIIQQNNPELLNSLDASNEIFVVDVHKDQ